MFLTFKTRQVFTKLRQTLVEAPILNHFDLEHHICIQIDVFSYAMSGNFGPLTLNNLSQWHLIAF